MVAGRIIEGSPQEIAEQLSGLTGTNDSVKVLLLEEPANEDMRAVPTELEVSRILAEMRDDAVSAGALDLSREGIYDERYR